MTVGIRKRKKITEAQYLAMERASETKHEFLDGEVYAMTGASQRLNLMVGSTFVSLYNQLRGQPCRLYSSDMRVKDVLSNTMCVNPTANGSSQSTTP